VVGDVVDVAVGVADNRSGGCVLHCLGTTPLAEFDIRLYHHPIAPGPPLWSKMVGLSSSWAVVL